ncbi:hypothetical protein K466DRAFT_479271 [Polyporus arcularius HHB13444]|uniref:F-box domain-containing protein n=1 Tax=Polyporus arcularius HHB13444 TaxID=1314778 RepID=A0A5C3PTY1_9APHY|nr:hypothetical protein K466DRAFT_479271 [Polyporus arcularius HHB13444]
MIQAEPGGCATIAVLARTAKCFHDAALDTLWQTQASLVPLVKCLPEDSLTETREDDGTRKLALSRELASEDWTRFKVYAERIRAIRLDPYQYSSYFAILKLAGSVYVTFKKCIGNAPLLPNLRSFQWSQVLNNESEDVASLLLMLNPKVSSMDVVLSTLSDDAAKEVATALSNFGENPAQLRNIRIISTPSAILEEAVLALGLRQQHLQEFHYKWQNQMTFETVSHLSSMNNLQQVSIRANHEISREVLKWGKERGGHFFPSLQLLALTTDSLDICEAWLSTIRHKGLNSLTFTVDNPPTASALRDFFTKLNDHPAHDSLRKIRFSSTTPSTRGNGQHVVTEDTLSPLLRLDLSVLKLEPGAHIEITDDFVARMARAWPRLRMLELNAEWRRYAFAPSVTLAGLIPLAQHCPDVGALALAINTDVSAFQAAYEDGHRPTGGHSFRQCHMFGVGPSAITREADQLMIAGFLSDLCPDLVSLQSAWTRAGPPAEGDTTLDQENEEMSEPWKQVEKYAREMARVRRQERMWME